MKLKGFRCPTCVGVRLHVVTIHWPLPVVAVRYRECSTCGHRMKTVEREQSIQRKKLLPK